MDCAGNFVGTAFLLLLFFVAAFDRTRKDSFDLSVNALPKTITFVSLFAAISLIATSLYVGFTPVGSTTIAGCQFRYFFPLFPIFFYFVGSVRLRSFISERALTVATLGGGVLANLIAIFDRIVASY